MGSDRVTVGVVGVGAMGMGVAKALIAKGFPVFVRDIVRQREDDAIAAGAQPLPDRVDVLISLVVDAARRGEVRGGVGRVRRRDARCAHFRRTGARCRQAQHDGGGRRGGLRDVPAGDRCDDGEMLSHGRQAGRRIAHESRQQHACRRQHPCRVRGDGARGQARHRPRPGRRRRERELGRELDVRRPHGARPRGRLRAHCGRARAPQGRGLFVDAAHGLGLSAPMAEQAQAIFRDTVARGYGEEDDAAVLKRYADLWDAPVPR